ncbi:ChrR family anti-sigma-E factor [Rhizobium grahamii]|uniref:Transcriptional regulator n=2 Tax=Rhizobium grahamii TaxID=1120045 RepID=S3IAC7_9HYPH|nr:ChrR family anti-sigma-E factor [Rhizobium grahamii]EPE96223.1 transcriptional regulator [Rhizobium grahamii CCGE 502]RDJ03032.1 transcriptional regulator [Rhizobium grahamii]
MIQHHLTDEMIAAMAAGTLEAGWALGATTHLTMCSACRAGLHAFERIGGYFLECEVANDNLDEGWREMERRITESQWEEDPVTSSPRSEAEMFLPEPLATYVDRAGGLKWRFLGRGAAQMIVPTEDETTTVRLLKIPAGQPVPEHSHRGTELTLVLDGSFTDEVSTFGPGDVEIADGTLTHTPRATEGKDCICLAVTDAPLKFSSLHMRLFQRLFKI